MIGKYFENNAHKKEAYQIISEKSKIDLDIDEVFKTLDRTSSKIGQQYLYFKLRTIGTLDALLKFDALRACFQKDKEASISCQIELSKLNVTSSFYSFFISYKKFLQSLLSCADRIILNTSFAKNS